MLNVVFENIVRTGYRLKGDIRFRYFDLLKKSLLLTRKEMVTYQNRLIQQIIQYAYENTHYYKNVMQSLNLKPNDIQNKSDLNKLPVLTKSIIREKLSDLRSHDVHGKNLKLVTSGGSSGNQAHIYKSLFFEQYSRAFFLRNNLIADWKPGDKSVWIWGSPLEHEHLKGSFKAKLAIWGNRRLLFNAYNYSTDDFSVWIKRIAQYKPKVLYGYATIILQFAEYLLENDIRLFSIKSVVSTSETLKGREIIEQAFDCKVYNQYGCREILAIGIEIEKDLMMIADDAVALNMTDEGDFIVTALHSYGFPLINYKIGDSGELIDNQKKADNFPFSTFRLKIGRITDNFITKKQTIVSSSALGTYISTFKLGLREQQIVQSHFNNFTVNYVPDKDFNFNSYENVIGRVLEEYFGPGNKIKYQSMDRILPEKSGKKLMFKRTFLMD